MKKYLILLALIGMMSEAKAQLWTTDNRVPQNPTDHYSNLNGTFRFQPDASKNTGTSTTNSMYRNDAAFYNKDNNMTSPFPTSNGANNVPGSLGNNTGNYQNSNAPGSSNTPTPVYINNTNTNNANPPQR
jgi:hypothetical protein